MHDDWTIAIKPRPRRPGGERVYVSINKRGEIAMNAEAFRRIGQPATVTLLYDDVHKRIGVKFPVPLDRNFFPVRRYGRGQQMRIVRAAKLECRGIRSDCRDGCIGGRGRADREK